MKKILSATIIIAGLVAFTSCNDDINPQSEDTATAFGGIEFSVGQNTATRTQYSTQDWLQIEWLMDDKITIACDQTQAPISITDKNTAGYYDSSNWGDIKSAEYKVNQLIADTHDVPLSNGSTASVTTNNKAKITSVSTDLTKRLYWGKNNPDGSQQDHTFYAGYGENITINPSSGVATCR